MAESFLKQLAKELAPYLIEGLRGANEGDEWVDQYRSPLKLPGQKSSVRHCHLVRARLARLGPGQGAYISPDEKQFFLTRAALCEEMSGLAPAPPLAKTSAPEPPEPEPAAEPDDGYSGMMRLIQGGKP